MEKRSEMIIDIALTAVFPTVILAKRYKIICGLSNNLGIAFNFECEFTKLSGLENEHIWSYFFNNTKRVFLTFYTIAIIINRGLAITED